MKGTSTKIELQCEKCGFVQKVDGDKYEVKCKKCGELINVEQALDAYVSGSAQRKIDVNQELNFDEYLSRGLAYLQAEDYGFAQEYLKKALELNAESAEANWALCRAVLCVGNFEAEPLVCEYVTGDRSAAIRKYAEQNNINETMSEFKLEEKLKSLAKYTDEETDEYMQQALEFADADLKSEIELQYAVLSYRSRARESDSEHDQAEKFSDAVSSLKPSFGRRKSAFEWKSFLVFVCGFLASLAAIAMIACNLSNGWTIALLVIGVFVTLMGLVAFMMNARRREICMLITKYSPEHIDDVVSAIFKVTDTRSLEQGRMTVLIMVRSLVRSNSLIGVGVRDGKDFVYYDEFGNEEVIIREKREENTEKHLAIIDNNEENNENNS